MIAELNTSNVTMQKLSVRKTNKNVRSKVERPQLTRPSLHHEIVPTEGVEVVIIVEKDVPRVVVVFVPELILLLFLSSTFHSTLSTLAMLARTTRENEKTVT